jgi:4-aminobutyrate aminotransferase-like enzyme
MARRSAAGYVTPLSDNADEHDFIAHNGHKNIGTRLDNAALALAREQYAAKNPKSLAANRRAQSSMPGGNTRSVLHFDPFPLTMVKGVGGWLFDLDGHDYVDFVGEFSAGLFGHSNPVIKAAIHEALERGIVMAAPTGAEADLAEVVSARFPSMELVRFCNSGTEANLMAIVTAIAVTGGGCLPVPVRDRGNQPLTTRRAPVPTRHVGGCPSLVDEDQPVRV